MTAILLGRWEADDPRWHEARSNRIGGSEIGAICGWSPFQTREQLLAEKTGMAERKPCTPAMERGNYLESSIAAWLADKEKITYDDTKMGTWIADDNPFQVYNPDGITSDGRLAEFKTTSVRDAEHGWGRAGTDQVPLTYQAQVMYGMGLLGLNECLLAVLSGAPRFEFARYRIRFHQPTYDYLVGQAALFYDEMQATIGQEAA